MLLDPMGGIVITNDGNCILREVMCCIVNICVLGVLQLLYRHTAVVCSIITIFVQLGLRCCYVMTFCETPKEMPTRLRSSLVVIGQSSTVSHCGLVSGRLAS